MTWLIIQYNTVTKHHRLMEAKDVWVLRACLCVRAWAWCPVFPSDLWSELYSLSHITGTWATEQHHFLFHFLRLCLCFWSDEWKSHTNTPYLKCLISSLPSCVVNASFSWHVCGTPQQIHILTKIDILTAASFIMKTSLEVMSCSIYQLSRLMTHSVGDWQSSFCFFLSSSVLVRKWMFLFYSIKPFFCVEFHGVTRLRHGHISATSVWSLTQHNTFKVQTMTSTSR